MKRKIYNVPIVECCLVPAEKGFAGSNGQLPEYKEDDDVIIIG